MVLDTIYFDGYAETVLSGGTTTTTKSYSLNSLHLAVVRETIHTTQKHPWLTSRGWITAGQLHIGDQVQQLDGSTATVVSLRVIAGAASMYDLTVSDVHTFTVGHAQVVVHNCGADLSWSSKTVKQAASDLDNGAKNVTVSSRSEAEELFLRKFQGVSDATGKQFYRNATGFDGPGVKDFFGRKAGTYHWDVEMDPQNFGRVLGHGLNNPDGALPHLQIHPFGGGFNIHIFFPWEI